MAAMAADPFDTRVIDDLNQLLSEKCPSLSLFYKSKIRKNGNYKRRIGFYYNKTLGDVVYNDVEVSYIMLDENIKNEIKIDFSETLEESKHNIKFRERKLTLCLLYLTGMIAATEKVELRAFAVSPIILYTMVKYFDCTIKKGAEVVHGDISRCQSLSDCKEYMEQEVAAPGTTDDYKGDAISVDILTSVPNYDDMLQKLEKVINELNCVGLGGTRRKRKKKRTKRS